MRNGSCATSFKMHVLKIKIADLKKNHGYVLIKHNRLIIFGLRNYFKFL